MNDTEANEVNNLLKLLEPELQDFQKLIKDMSLIDSPYKNEFNYMRTMVNKEKFGNLEGKLNLLIAELNQFGTIYEKIVEDDEVSELYVASGLLDRSVELQTRIMNKLS